MKKTENEKKVKMVFTIEKRRDSTEVRESAKVRQAEIYMQT